MLNKIVGPRQSNRFKLFLWGAVLLLLLVAAAISVSSALVKNTEPLVINEFLASNGSGLTDEDGDFVDWIEIYNSGNRPVNLAGYALTDDPSQSQKWPLPDTTLNSGEYLLVFASGKNRHGDTPDAPLHTNFRLNKAGDFLGLYNILNQQFADTVEASAAPQFRDMSYGRYGDGTEFGYLVNPTPGRPNDNSQVWVDVVEPVNFSKQRGFYQEPFVVELSTSTPDATIYYTTDGSTPGPENGIAYTEPIQVNSTALLRAAAFKDGWLASPAGTHSYIYTNDVLTQAANPPGFPQSWGTHQVDFDDYVAGTPVEPDYEMDPEIVNNPNYRDKLVEGLTAIPSLSIVTDMQNFTDVYSNPQWRGMPSERATSVELIVPDGSEPGFQTDAGLRIQGGVGRNEFYTKHSFRLFFRNAYGEPRLNYPFFPDSPVSQFDTLVLRGGVNRSFSGIYQNRKTTYTRDEWLRASQLATSGVGSHGRFVHVYINGLYWGMYNVVERPDAPFMASYFGGEDEEWVVMNHGGPVDGPEDALGELIEHYKSFMSADADPQSRADLREIIAELVDIPQLVDYIILNWYGGNQDWGENNWYASRRLPDGLLRYFVWDAEKIFFEGSDIYLGRTEASRPNVVFPIFNLLWDDPEFRIFFADKLHAHLFNNGPLTDENARARWLKIATPLEQAIVGESARWGDVREPDDPITQDDWLNANEQVLAQIDGNASRLIELTREKGYYPHIDPPAFSQHGGVVDNNFSLEISAPTGTVYYTTNGSDPRLPGGEVSPAAVAYGTPVPITQATLVKARAFDGAEWSALTEAAFHLAGQVGRLHISEIMYNPIGGSDYEFIELKNAGSTPVNLANSSFVEGIRFTFPANTPPLQPDRFVVLASNAKAFSERYPTVSIAGVYQGQLANQGEKITLQDSRGNVITQVAYDDEQGWPITPDGRGDSLVLINFAEDPGNPQNWGTSANLHGSPGEDDPAFLASP